MDRETYIEILNKLAALEDQSAVDEARIDVLENQLAAMTKQLASISQQLNDMAYIQPILKSLVDSQIAALSVTPSAHEDSELLPTSALHRGDQVRFVGFLDTSDTLGRFRVFDHYELAKGQFRAYMDIGVYLMVPSLSALVWQRKP
jgi:uncharacterized coiled-coil protein SlyX